MDDVEPGGSVLDFHQFLSRTHRNWQNFPQPIADPSCIGQIERFQEWHIFRVAICEGVDNPLEYFGASGQLRQMFTGGDRTIRIDQRGVADQQAIGLGIPFGEAKALGTAGAQ